MTEYTPEALHGSIMRSYGQLGMLPIEACGIWLVDIDTSFDPPKIHLSSKDTNTSFTLDGSSIYTKSDGELEAFFPDAKTEEDAVTELTKLFGGF